MGPRRRLAWLSVVSGALSAASALAAHRLVARVPNDNPTGRVLVALIPVPFFLFFIVAESRWIGAQDEYHRKVVLDSLAIAFPLVIAEAVTLEALQRGGLLLGVSVGDFWPYMAITWVACWWIAARRYR